jgi:hypothetical protein
MAARMTEVAARGQPCRDFATCAALLAASRNIDYDGPSNTLQLGADGDPERARFDLFEFNDDGVDVSLTPSLMMP